jgi:ribosomal-protein-alanine N-acetyltransferase
MSHLHTRRLRLVPATAETTALELSGHGRLGVMLGCTVPAEWPPDEARHALPIFEAALRDRPEEASWWAWYWITAAVPSAMPSAGPSAGPVLVGGGGFLGPPNASGVVEVGYSTLARYRRLGFAGEAVDALTVHALAQPGVRRVEAECHPHNVGSLGVLRRCRFEYLGPGDEPGTRRFGRAT